MNTFGHIVEFLRTLARPYPARDWRILIAFCGMLVLALIMIAVYFFIGIQSGAIIAPETPEVPRTVTVSREGLQKILGAYEVRTLNFESKNYRVPDVADPSR